MEKEQENEPGCVHFSQLANQFDQYKMYPQLPPINSEAVHMRQKPNVSQIKLIKDYANTMLQMQDPKSLSSKRT